MNTLYKSIFTLAGLIFLMACNTGPKVVQPSGEQEETKSSGIFTPDPATQVTPNASQPFSNELHTVSVNEVLQASRYVYLNVTEGKSKFWIATRKQEIEKGEMYFYRGGLLKTNFESKEYNKLFDTIYLVSNLVSKDHSKHAGAIRNDKVSKKPLKEDIPTHTDKLVEHKGSIKIAELIKEPKKYEGHTVQLSGKCVKVNPNIMNRNWIHLKDGSKDDFDLVITSDTFVPEGSIITIRAMVILNKDFGAGYKYDLILENGTLVE